MCKIIKLLHQHYNIRWLNNEIHIFVYLGSNALQPNPWLPAINTNTSTTKLWKLYKFWKLFLDLFIKLFYLMRILNKTTIKKVFIRRCVVGYNLQFTQSRIWQEFYHSGQTSYKTCLQKNCRTFWIVYKFFFPSILHNYPINQLEQIMLRVRLRCSV